MPVIQHPDTPHIFCPRIAEKHGLQIAVVEYASRDLCRGQDSKTFEEIKIGFNIEALIKKCSYLTETQVRDSVKKLVDLGMLEVEE